LLTLPRKPDACELCARKTVPLTKHHLIPRTLHRNKRIRKRFTKEQCLTQIAWLCMPCHKSIHRLLSEKEMAADYFTITALAHHPDIADFVSWIKNKPAGFKPKFSRRTN
jgi:hypothetical protein